MDSLWTQDDITELTAKCQFIVVTPIGLPKVNITDAKAIWVLHEDFMFNTLYRFAGKKADIMKQLKEVDYDKEDFAQFIDNVDNMSITSKNFEELTNEDGYSVYEAELVEYNEWVDQIFASQKVKGLTLFELLKIVNPHMSLLEEKEVVPRIPTKSTQVKSTQVKSTPPSPSKGNAGRKGKDLQTKINELDEGKIINVSGISVRGTDTLTIKRPESSRLFIPPNLPFISNNLEHFIIALNLIGGEEQYPDDYEAAMNFSWKENHTPKSKVTTTTRKVPISQSKASVPEAVAPIRKNLLLSIQDNTDNTENTEEEI